MDNPHSIIECRQPTADADNPHVSKPSQLFLLRGLNWSRKKLQQFEQPGKK